VSHDTLAMDPIKIAGVAEWPIPRTVKEVQAFLGFGNFYRRFIKDFSKIARPLFDLTRKDAHWNWDEDCMTAFTTLKQAFVSEPVLLMPDNDKPFKVEVDASDYATGGILMQTGNDEKWHPVAYLSKSLSETERNYDIRQRITRYHPRTSIVATIPRRSPSYNRDSHGPSKSRILPNGTEIESLPSSLGTIPYPI
jgi:hypothetical protein